MYNLHESDKTQAILDEEYQTICRRKGKGKSLKLDCIFHSIVCEYLKMEQTNDCDIFEDQDLAEDYWCSMYAPIGWLRIPFPYQGVVGHSCRTITIVECIFCSEERECLL